MKSRKTMLCVKFILAVVLAVVVCVGTTGCAELLQILQYLGEDFYLGNGGYNDFDYDYDLGASADPASIKILPDLPDADFNAYNFTILAENKSRDVIVTEEETGELINDSVFMRNIRTEEKYNIYIKSIFADNVSNIVKRAIMAGDDAFDLFVIPMNETAQMSTQGFFVNLYNIPYIDFSKPWWNQNAVEQLTIANKPYFTTSDFLISDKEATSVFLFNKGILQNYGLEDPYTLVKQGKWTVDKMWEMAKCVSIDLNGDGKMDENDSYGLLTGTDMLYNSVLSSGDFLIEKDKDDLPIVNFTESMLTSFNKWTDIYNDGIGTFILKDSKEKLVMFGANLALFMNENMSLVPEMRRYEADFGILPNPKSDVTQESYRNAVNPSMANAVSVPVTSADLDRTGIILEALTAESYYTLLPSYYDMSLMTKFYRDEESAEMLDIIFASRVYDLGQVYNWGGINDKIIDIGKNEKTVFVSEFEKFQRTLQKETEKTTIMYMNID